jgi:hypothetical protein
MSAICMKLDPGMHIGLHLCFLWKNRCDKNLEFSKENPNPYTFAIVPGSVAIVYRTYHR